MICVTLLHLMLSYRWLGVFRFGARSAEEMDTAQEPSNRAAENRPNELQRTLGYRSPFKFLREFRTDPLAFFAMLRNHADVAPFRWSGTGTIIYLFHPDAARQVLQDIIATTERR